jgi:hypothetical protein
MKPLSAIRTFGMNFDPKLNNPLANAVMGFDAITAAEDTAEIYRGKNSRN